MMIQQAPSKTIQPSLRPHRQSSLRSLPSLSSSPLAAASSLFDDSPRPVDHVVSEESTTKSRRTDKKMVKSSNHKKADKKKSSPDDTTSNSHKSSKEKKKSTSSSSKRIKSVPRRRSSTGVISNNKKTMRNDIMDLNELNRLYRATSSQIKDESRSEDSKEIFLLRFFNESRKEVIKSREINKQFLPKTTPQTTPLEIDDECDSCSFVGLLGWNSGDSVTSHTSNTTGREDDDNIIMSVIETDNLFPRGGGVANVGFGNQHGLNLVL